MNILITGAAGFLGTWFFSHYYTQGAGHDIWQVDIAPRPDSFPMDAQDLGLWLEDFDVDIDIAFHFAAPVGGREKIEGDPLYNADSLRLDSLFFRWAVKHAKTVVFPSSSAVYGQTYQRSEDSIRLHETLFQPQDDVVWPVPDQMYGFTKLSGEVLAWRAAAYGLNTLCIRPFSGYGDGQTFDYPIPSILRRALHDENPIEVWGPGTQKRDFVHASDIVGATMARLEAGVEGYQTMNIGSGVGHSFNEIAAIAAEIRGYDPEILNLQDKPMGVFNRIADPTRMERYYTPEVDLHAGLKRTMDYIAAKEAAEAVPNG